LRKLHPQFGVGEPRDVEVGGGHKEREYILDIPMRLVHDFQFRQERGLDFHGALMGGRVILSRDFQKEKLELRWVSPASLEGLLRRVPGKDVEKVMFKDIRTLRISTFTGKVAFISRQANAQISFHDVGSISFRLKPGYKEIKPLQSSAKDNLAGQVVRFDYTVMTDNIHSNLTVQNALKDHYFRRLLWSDEEKNYRLRLYTQRLSVGAVGPLAGQTLKLLRRYGLENLIEASGFHYLCDSANQLPTYDQTVDRFEAHFRKLVDSLRHIATIRTTGHIRVDDISHQMPIVTEWVDTANMPFTEIAVQDLEAAYGEILILIDFIDHEFRRKYQSIEEEDKQFFVAIQATQEAALTTKWLADYKNGAFGPAFPPGKYPDFVFFGTPKDKTANDKSYYFPGLVCSELFANPENQDLFTRGDYGFSVFLEKELALADHAAREEGLPKATPEYFDAYYEKRAGEAQKKVDELEEILKYMHLTDSPQYQQMLKEEEARYMERHREFTLAQEKVRSRHREAEMAFQEALLKIHPHLTFPTAPHPDWLKGDEPDPSLLGRDMVEIVEKTQTRLQVSMQARLDQSEEVLKSHLAKLGAFTQSLQELFAAHWAWQSAALALKEDSLKKEGAGAAVKRMDGLKRMKKEDLPDYLTRIESQASNTLAEHDQFRARTNLHFHKGRQAAETLHHAVSRLIAQFSQAKPKVFNPEQDLARQDLHAKKIGDITRTLLDNNKKMVEEMTRIEQMVLQQTKLLEQAIQLRGEVEAVKAVLENRSPGTFPYPGGEGLETRQIAAHREFQGKKAPHKGAEEGLETMHNKPIMPDEVRKEALHYMAFADSAAKIKKMTALKERMRISTRAIAERMRIMDEELVDLPKRVEEKFMPARKELMIRVFIPEEKRHVENYIRAKSFVQELLHLPQEKIRSLYLNRAVFKRYYTRQFIKGMAVHHNPQAAGAQRLTNIMQSLAQFYRNMQHNINKQHPNLAQYLSLSRMNPTTPPILWDYIQQVAALGEKAPIGYLILPATLTLEQAVRMMNQKDRLYRGIPMLVLVFVSKFDPAQIIGDPRFREEYFSAVRHNTIVNLDDVTLADNPRTIGLRLLNETLGSAYDTPLVEEVPEGEDTVAVKV
ncbi:MAG: hypothetical protein OEW12_03925, partial [Deltaproteobacteria bacterium]|nr:hypothetical protein [Deltaproteobacteria bacterium]